MDKHSKKLVNSLVGFMLCLLTGILLGLAYQDESRGVVFTSICALGMIASMLNFAIEMIRKSE